MPSYADISNGWGDQLSYLGGPLSLGERDYWNAIPEAGYYAHLARQGYGGTDPRARYAQSQFGRYFNLFQADAARNPTLGFYDWYLQGGFDPGAEYANLSPEQRGDFSSRYLTPRVRWSLGG
jgi:hypothetical protein